MAEPWIHRCRKIYGTFRPALADRGRGAHPHGYEHGGDDVKDGDNRQRHFTDGIDAGIKQREIEGQVFVGRRCGCRMLLGRAGLTIHDIDD